MLLSTADFTTSNQYGKFAIVEVNYGSILMVECVVMRFCSLFVVVTRDSGQTLSWSAYM